MTVVVPRLEVLVYDGTNGADILDMVTRLTTRGNAIYDITADDGQVLLLQFGDTDMWQDVVVTNGQHVVAGSGQALVFDDASYALFWHEL